LIRHRAGVRPDAPTVTLPVVRRQRRVRVFRRARHRAGRAAIVGGGLVGGMAVAGLLLLLVLAAWPGLFWVVL
jgi:hypothetical protein